MGWRGICRASRPQLNNDGDVMNVYTEKEAATKYCPHAACHCNASNCMAWRWQELMADDAWIEAVKKAAVELDDKTPGRSKASAHVNKNRAAYGLPSEPYLGYCGLAGKP